MTSIANPTTLAAKEELKRLLEALKEPAELAMNACGNLRKILMNSSLVGDDATIVRRELLHLPLNHSDPSFEELVEKRLVWDFWQSMGIVVTKNMEIIIPTESNLSISTTDEDATKTAFGDCLIRALRGPVIHLIKIYYEKKILELDKNFPVENFVDKVVVTEKAMLRFIGTSKKKNCYTSDYNSVMSFDEVASIIEKTVERIIDKNASQAQATNHSLKRCLRVKKENWFNSNTILEVLDGTNETNNTDQTGPVISPKKRGSSSMPTSEMPPSKKRGTSRISADDIKSASDEQSKQDDQPSNDEASEESEESEGSEGSEESEEGKAPMSTTGGPDSTLEETEEYHQPSAAEMARAIAKPGLYEYVNTLLGGKTIDELMEEDDRYSEYVRSLHSEYAGAIRDMEEVIGNDDKASGETKFERYDIEHNETLTSVLSFVRNCTPATRCAITRFLYYTLEYERFKCHDRHRVVRLLCRNESDEEQGMFLLYGTQEDPYWATPGMYSDDAAAKFLFAFDDFLRERVLEPYLRNCGTEKPWSVRLPVTNAIQVYIGNAFGAHRDSQPNLSCEKSPDMPSTSSDIIVNTMYFEIDPRNEFSFGSKKNGTFEFGIQKEVDDGKGGTKFKFEATIKIPTRDGDNLIQLFGSQSESFRHRAVNAGHFTRIVCSCRSMIVGVQKVKDCYYDNADKIIENAIRRRTRTNHKFFGKAHHLLGAGSNIVQEGDDSDDNGGKRGSHKRPTIHRLPKHFVRPTAYVRHTKEELGPKGNAWKYVTRIEALEVLFEKGVAGVNVKKRDGTVVTFGLPVIDGEILEAGKCYPTDKINEIHHFQDKKRGQNVCSTDHEVTALKTPQFYKSGPELHEKKTAKEVEEDQEFFGSGGSAASADAFGNERHGSVGYFMPHPQDMTNATNRALSECAPRVAVVNHYDPKIGAKENKCFYGGLYQVVSGVNEIPSKETKERIQEAVKKKKKDLKHTSYLSETCLCLMLRPTRFDKSSVKQTTEEPQYLWIDEDVKADELFRTKCKSEEKTAATQPILGADGKTDESAMIVPMNVVVRTLRETDLTRYTHNWDVVVGDKPKTWRAGGGDDDGGEEDDDDKGRRTVPAVSMRELFEHSILCAAACDARCLGHGHEVSEEGKVEIRPLGGLEFASCGAALRVHPNAHPTRWKNPTCIRYALGYSQALNDGKELKPDERRYFRNRHGIEWFYENRDEGIGAIVAAICNRAVSSPHVWEGFAEAKAKSRGEKVPSEKWSDRVVGPGEIDDFVDYVETTEFTHKRTPVKDLNSGQFAVPFTEKKEIRPFISGIAAAVEKAVDELSTDNGTPICRKKFRERLVRWTFDNTPTTDSNTNRRSVDFLIGNAVQDFDILFRNVFAEPTEETQVLGVGSREGLKHIRAHLEERGDEEHKGKALTDVYVLWWVWKETKRFIVKPREGDEELSELFCRVMGISAERGEPIYKYNLMPVMIDFVEFILCDVIYRPFQKTLPSRITLNPRGYSLWTHPEILDGGGLKHPDDLIEEFKTRLEHYKTWVKGFSGREIPKPPLVFRLYMEHAEDAFDSGDEELAEKRRKKEEEAKSAMANEPCSSDEE